MPYSKALRALLGLVDFSLALSLQAFAQAHQLVPHPTASGISLHLGSMALIFDNGITVIKVPMLRFFYCFFLVTECLEMIFLARRLGEATSQECHY